MRLISYEDGGEAAVGVMVDETGFLALSKADPELPNTIQGILEMTDGIDRVRAAASGMPPGLSLEDVKMLPVIPRPNAIWALALNYKKKS